MKKLLFFLAILFLGISYSECSYSDECDQIDWIGIYKLSTSSTSTCTNSQGNSIIPDEIIIEPGSTSKKIILNGEEVDFYECEADGDFGYMNIEYGEFTLSINGCNGSYTRS